WRVEERIKTGKIDVDRIDKPAVRWLIRASPLPIRREEGMQWIDAGHRAAQSRSGFAEPRQRLEIADPGILAVPEGIKGRGQSERSCAAGDASIQEAGRRAYDETADVCRILRANGVVIPGRKRGQRNGQMAYRLAPNHDSADLGKALLRKLKMLRVPVLESDGEANGPVALVLRHRQSHPSRRSRCQQL